MIDAIEITNLRGIRNGRLTGLAPVTVLVGPNGAGKSTVLEALAISATHQPPALIGRLVQSRGAWNGARYLIGDPTRPATLTAHLGDLTATVDLTWHDSVEPERAERPKGGEGPGAGRFSAIEFTVADDETERARGRVVIDGANRYGWRASRSLTHRPRLQFVHPAQARDWPLWKNLNHAREQGRLDEVYGLLKTLLGDDFRELYVHPEGEGELLNVHVQYRDHSVPVAVAGDGVRTLVRLALEVAGEPGSCVLIEEPEVHQHPRAIWLTAEAILTASRRGVQVILSTHSLELIDALVALGADDTLADRLALIRLKLDDGTLTHSRLAGDAVSRMRTVIEEDLR